MRLLYFTTTNSCWPASQRAADKHRAEAETQAGKAVTLQAHVKRLEAEVETLRSKVKTTEREAQVQ